VEEIRGQINFHDKKEDGNPAQLKPKPGRVTPNTNLYNPNATQHLPSPPPNPKKQKKPQISRPEAFSFQIWCPGVV